VADQDLARSSGPDSSSPKTLPPAMEVTCERPLTVLGLLLTCLLLTSCDKQQIGTDAGTLETVASRTSQPVPASTKPISPALSAFGQSTATTCDRVPADLCADQLRVLTIRGEAVVKELRTRSDLSNVQVGLQLGESFALMSQQDLLDSTNQEKAIHSAKELNS
jgi:hypothetical protein